jgi:hypothetical protein|tara:strand:- start:665 stop:814 length:150 start_codon:yes stop_codon:yes gene_type:complete
MFKKILTLLKKLFKKVQDLFLIPYIKVKREIEYKKRLKELRKRDPFIYK